MASEPVARALAEEVVRWGSMQQTGVSLRYMMEFGSRPTPRNLLISAQFLQRELPIRIARRALELDSLPFGLSNKPAILKVRDWYLDSFRDIRYFPEVRNQKDELAFTEMIKMVKVRHNNVVPTMALGVQQLKHHLCHARNIPFGFDEIHGFLDRFYMSRIGLRMLIGQHVALHRGAGHEAEPLLLLHGAVPHRRHRRHAHRQEPQQEARLLLRRLHRHGRHRRQRRPARRVLRARVRARGRQHHRHQGHRLRLRARHRPHRQLRHQEVGRVPHHHRPGDEGRRQGGRAQDQEDWHPGPLRGHQGHRARAASAREEEEANKGKGRGESARAVGRG